MTEVVDILASNYVTKGLEVILLINRGGMQIDGGFKDRLQQATSCPCSIQSDASS